MLNSLKQHLFILLSILVAAGCSLGSKSSKKSIDKNNAAFGENQTAHQAVHEDIQSEQDDNSGMGKPIVQGAPTSLTCSPSEINERGFILRRMRVLSNIHISNLLKDALGDDFKLPPLGTEYEPETGIRSNAEKAVDPGFLENLNFLSLAASEHLINNKDSTLKGLFGCGDSVDISKSECQKNFIKNFGRKLFRKNLSDIDTKKYTDFYASLETGTAEEKFRLLAEFMILSPDFLYISELGDKNKIETASELSSIEVASIIALFLTDHGPDDELLSLAESGKLMEPATLKSQILRLLNESQGEDQASLGGQFFARFVRDWLNIEKIEINDSGVFEKLNLRNTSKEELEGYLQKEVDIVANEAFDNQANTFSYLFNYDNSRVNQPLAILYGSDGGEFTANDFSEFQFKSTERKGILTSAAYLASHSDGTKHISRGTALNLDVLCVEIPPFPDLKKAADLEEDELPIVEEDPNMTERERFEAHSLSPCAACHKIMDPPGWALSNFDQSGIYSAIEEKSQRPIDASGKVVLSSGETFEFKDAIEFTSKVSELQDSHYCFSKKLYNYFTGTNVTNKTLCDVKGFTKKFYENNGNVKELIVDLLTSEVLLKRE